MKKFKEIKSKIDIEKFYKELSSQKYPDKLKAKRVIHSIHSKVKFSKEKLKKFIIHDDTQFI